MQIILEAKITSMKKIIEERLVEMVADMWKKGGWEKFSMARRENNRMKTTETEEE